MRWSLELTGEKDEVVQVELKEILPKGGFVFEVDGRELTLGAVDISLEEICFEGRRLHCEIWEHQNWRVTEGSQVYRMRPLRAGQEAQSGSQQLQSQMPGRVLKVLCKVGQEVQAGQTLLIIEAMKMENEIRADRQAIIKEIFVEEKQSLESGSPLLEFENPSD
ncbi:MAG: biotin/lipoyl-binding protein [Bradymonadales bacterium]|nr:MAG: biotin/lipoyl-binding protein [Bradymonadales bacterium]